MICCVILDFDGTLTDPDQESGRFLPDYQTGLAHLLGVSIQTLRQAWQRARESVYAAPDAHGWRYDDKIVAPAHTDPYVLPACLAYLLLDEAGLLLDPKERRARLQVLFRETYARVPVMFRPGAAELLETLLAGELSVFVVSNSDTTAVEKKIDSLGLAQRHKLQIRGNALKFVLAEPQQPDPQFDALPEQIRLRGLSRPVYVRRGHYYDILRQVFAAAGCQPSEAIVCGDIYELDLALPALLGCAVHLVIRPNTAPYEIEAVQSSPVGSAAPALARIRQRVLGG